MSNPVTVTLALTASSSNCICLSQAVSGAGALTLNGANVSSAVGYPNGGTNPVARRLVAVSSNNADTTQKITYVGADRYGNALTETDTLNGTTAVQTQQDFLTVTSVSVSAAMTGNITVGTNGVGSTQWFVASFDYVPFQIGIGCYRSTNAAVSATVERTRDDPNANLPGTTEPQSNIPPLAWPDSVINNLALGQWPTLLETTLSSPIFAYRLTVNSGTGTAVMQAIPAGIVN